jgi:UDP-N-acetyl-D-galactosamine dehydrogenase
MNVSKDTVVAVVGLGYVGLPLAIEFGKHFRTIGFDLSHEKIESYKARCDPTAQIEESEFRAARKLEFTHDASALAEADAIIIAVPTPVDSAHQPDLQPLVSASTSVGKQLRRGAVVIYESTVYPGVTEDVCVPILEKHSGLKWKTDFHVGYSPERINPGDKEHTLARITKVVSGDDAPTLEFVAELYGAIISAGVYRAPTIGTAEAAKVIENTQRDLNIALMNELAILFDRLGLETHEVLKAAGTKWNFLPFRPGLVGGHCIGVDPYYLTHKAEMVGYNPQVILAGRRINDGMGKFIAEKTVKLLAQAGHPVKGSKVNVLGLTFKENCPDLRNSRTVDVIRELEDFGVEVFIHDPWADEAEARVEYGLSTVSWDALPKAAAFVVAVAHDEFRSLDPSKIASKAEPNPVLVDVKSIYERPRFEQAGFSVWRL